MKGLYQINCNELMSIKNGVVKSALSVSEKQLTEVGASHKRIIMGDHSPEAADAVKNVYSRLNRENSKLEKVMAVLQAASDQYRSAEELLSKKTAVGPLSVKLDHLLSDLTSKLLGSVILRLEVLALGTDLLLVGEEPVRHVLHSTETIERIYSNIRAKLFSDKGSDIQKAADIKFYTQHASAAEYALLCHYWNKSARQKNPKEAFLNQLTAQKSENSKKTERFLPENDPLRGISSSQVQVFDDPMTGLSAAVITDNDKNALVLFAGTDKDIGDYIDDTTITFNGNTFQSREAAALINELSKEYDNITVSGHSLGGYLATSVTLQNSSVTKCVAFDPPGRYDSWYQNAFRGEYASKVTTYVADGSAVSIVGDHILSGPHIGNVMPPVKVEKNWAGPAPNHGIRQISDALGGVFEDQWDIYAIENGE